MSNLFGVKLQNPIFLENVWRLLQFVYDTVYVAVLDQVALPIPRINTDFYVAKGFPEAFEAQFTDST